MFRFGLGLTLKSVTGSEYKVNTNKLIRNAYFHLIQLLPNLFFFGRMKIFYSGNNQYVYNFYGTDLYENVCRGVFKTQSNMSNMVNLLCENHEKALLQMFYRFLNTPLVYVLHQKRFTQCQYVTLALEILDTSLP